MKKFLASALALMLVLPMFGVVAEEAEETNTQGETEIVTEAPETDGEGEVTEDVEDTEEAEDTEETEETDEATDLPVPEPISVTFVKGFEDVTTDAWFAGDVEFVVEEGIMNGVSTTEFGAETTMTRGMVVTVLGRIDGIDATEYGTDESAFADVAISDYFSPYVEWAAYYGIVNGVSDENFAPDKNISREDFAVILNRYMEYKEIELPQTRQEVTFSDDESISEYAKDALYNMYYAGIINGGEGLVVNPQGEATRAEVAAMLHRFVEKAGL